MSVRTRRGIARATVCAGLFLLADPVVLAVFTGYRAWWPGAVTFAAGVVAVVNGLAALRCTRGQS